MEKLDWEDLIKSFNRSLYNKKVIYACPICETGMSNYHSFFTCKNGCFGFTTFSTFINSVTVFNEFFQYRHICVDDVTEENKQVIIDIKNKIEYYRKDYRYLAEILEKS